MPRPLCVAHFLILGGQVTRMSEDDAHADAALAMAALHNACKDVPGEPRCHHVDAMRRAGWEFELTISDKGFVLTGRPRP